MQRALLGLDRARTRVRNFFGKDFDFSHGGPALGGAIAISCVLAVSRWCVGLNDAALMVASMGASAVLLFCVPEGALSRPWSVFGGHVISAFIGVACAKGIADPGSAAPLAVGLAILVMSICRCTHPPGGATALSAVIGGPAVHEMGLQYVFTPVLLNACVMLAVAWVFHLPTERYPLRRRVLERVAEQDATSTPMPGVTAWE